MYSIQCCVCWTYTDNPTPIWFSNIEYDQEHKEDEDETDKNGKKVKPHVDREYKKEDESGEKY